MLIPHHKIEEVLARADIVAIVGRSVQLKKSGRSYKGNCPFHNEKSPSFYVTPERHMWKCFGCALAAPGGPGLRGPRAPRVPPSW